MEGMPKEPIIVGKGLDEKLVNFAQQKVEKNIGVGKEPIENELEKTRDEARLIEGVNTMLLSELSALNIEPERVLDEDQVHLFSKDDERVNKRAHGEFKTESQKIILKREEESFKEKTKNYISDLLGKEVDSSRNRYSFLKTLLHETIHHYGHISYHADIENKKVSTYRTGYAMDNTFNKEENHEHFSGFNEGVVERLTRELLDENQEFITKKLKIDEKEKARSDTDNNYDFNVRLVEILTEKIAEHENVPEQDVWERFKKGHFTGEMMHLRSIEKLYGENSLRFIASIDDIIKNKKSDWTAAYILTYLNEEDPQRRKEIYEKHLSGNF